jgi:hypothetical protein
MEKDEKKRLKAQAKTEKKQAKAHLKQAEEQLNTQPVSISKPTDPSPAPPAKTDSEPAPQPTPPMSKPSPAVRFAEAVRGVIYLIFAVSLILAVILREKGMLVSLDKIIENLIIIRIGQVVLVVIALSLFIYGLKPLRLVK